MSDKSIDQLANEAVQAMRRYIEALIAARLASGFGPSKQ